LGCHSSRCYGQRTIVWYTLSVTYFVAKRLLGVFCLLLGILALVTPLTPGAWLALIGIELLGLTFLLPRRVRTPYEEWKRKTWEALKRFGRRFH
jgi:hypothetical protein